MGGKPEEGLLAQEIASAGCLHNPLVNDRLEPQEKVQKMLCREIEDFRALKIEEEFRLLPSHDTTATAYIQFHSYSGRFIGALPNRMNMLSARDYYHAVSQYLGTPLLAIQDFVGMAVGVGDIVIDPMGNTLCAKMHNKGNGWKGMIRFLLSLRNSHAKGAVIIVMKIRQSSKGICAGQRLSVLNGNA